MPTRRTVVIATAALVGILVVLLITFWDYELRETKRLMLATLHSCPSGAVERIERGGELGWLRLCVKGEVRHGPFVYWKKKLKYAEGVYVEGRRTGNVSYYDESGKVTRVEEVAK